ncbi:MAG: hypothetical protein HC866_14675, partial [Leptolyngbyaceae cyanobacterium RU_5_1]|nr:hypothetical protein [Leptolyngbyaceae cyanobacterium RU_5_1]
RAEDGGRRAEVSFSSLIPHPPEAIVEARGWVVGADGVVELVAHMPAVNPARFWTAPVSCRAFQGN